MQVCVFRIVQQEEDLYQMLSDTYYTVEQMTVAVKTHSTSGCRRSRNPRTKNQLAVDQPEFLCCRIVEARVVKPYPFPTVWIL